MEIDPFDTQLLSDYEHLARLYPGLDLNQFRVLWQEAGDFMHDALDQGYEPEDVPALYTTVTASSIIKNGPRRLENKLQDIDLKQPRPHGGAARSRK